MSRLAATLAALIAALFGARSVRGPAIASAVLEPLAYSYDSHHNAALLAHSTTDRGPPAKYDHAAPNDALGRWSRGAVARPARGATLPIIVYDHPALLVQSAGAVTTPEVTPDSSEPLSSFQPSDVATNAGARGGAGPVSQGAAGVERTVADLEGAGGRVLGREVTVEAGGVRTRPDLFVELLCGTRCFIQVKTGSNAGLTPNQASGFPPIRSGGAIPRGGNAAAAGLTPGTPMGLTQVWTVWQPWP